MADLSITAANVVAADNAVKETKLAGAAITAGQALYVDADSGKFLLADSDSATAAAKTASHIALNGAALNQPLTAMKSGDVTIGATLTAGATYFLSNTAGGICPDADVGSGENVCQIGIAKSTTVLSVRIQAPGVSR
jgi:hypothetical protein